MSQLIDKLKEVGTARRLSQSADTGTMSRVPGIRLQESQEQKAGPDRLLWTVIGCWAVTIIMAVILAVNSGSSRQVLTRQLTKTIRKQEAKIKELEKSLVRLNTASAADKKDFQDKLSGLRSQLGVSEKRLGEYTQALDAARDDLRDMQVNYRNTVQKFVELNSELRTLKLDMAKEQGGNKSQITNHK